MAGLKPLFKMSQVGNYLQDFHDQMIEKLIEKYQYIGEVFVNKARLSGNYTDRTGNLRSSIGYTLLIDGEVYSQSYEGNDDGIDKAKQVVNEVALANPEGIVLIGVAGMNYAAAVEAKGKDVITGSAPEAEFIKEILNDL